MPLQNELQRLHQLDAFLRRSAPGNASDLAERLGVSRRTLFRYFEQLSAWGAEIASGFLLFMLPLFLAAQDDPTVVVLCKANQPKCYTIKYLGLENDRDGKVCCNDFILNEKWFCWDDCTSNRLPQVAPNVEMDGNGQIVIDGEIIGRLAQPGPNPQIEVHYTNSSDWLRVETQKEVRWEIRKGNLYIEDAFICPISRNSLGKFMEGKMDIREIYLR